MDPVAGPSSASTSKLTSPVDEWKTPLSASTPIRENVSLRKLNNSSFERYKTKQEMLTREQANNAGIGSSPYVDTATGFKLQDAAKLKLFQRNEQREGLAESLFMKCSSCEVETPLQTSKRLGGKGGGAHVVNCRSVLASNQFGLTGLSQFCAGMKLPPPVTKKAYNQHLIQIKKAAVKNAEELMQDAAQRLREKLAAEEHSIVVE